MTPSFSLPSLHYCLITNNLHQAFTPNDGMTATCVHCVTAQSISARFTPSYIYVLKYLFIGTIKHAVTPSFWHLPMTYKSRILQRNDLRKWLFFITNDLRRFITPRSPLDPQIQFSIFYIFITQFLPFRFIRGCLATSAQRLSF